MPRRPPQESVAVRAYIISASMRQEMGGLVSTEVTLRVVMSEDARGDIDRAFAGGMPGSVWLCFGDEMPTAGGQDKNIPLESGAALIGLMDGIRRRVTPKK